jgi:hypothetical protein
MIFIITNDLYNIKLHMIQSYKQNPLLQEKYDTIIIGSGMGGLTTAIFFSKRVKSVGPRKSLLWWFYACFLSVKATNGMWEYII